MKNFLKNIFLFPLSFLWEKIYQIRRIFFEYGILKRNHFRVPVISIGNLTFGGTGKTPMTMWLIDFFENYNLIPLVLTRGYKGELEKGSGIIKGGQRFRSNPRKFGDEPLLISRKMNSGAVVVGRNRSENLRRYFSEVNPDVVILDDGFQHLKLHRNFNIVLFDALLPLTQYQTAPLGYLREGFTALKDADAIIITRTNLASEEQIEALQEKLQKYHSKNIPVAKAAYQITGVYNSFDELIWGAKDDVTGVKVVAVTALASPDSFYQSLSLLGFEIIESFSYPDHYFFSKEDMDHLIHICETQDAIILSSEKDMVKIRRISQSEYFHYLGIRVSFLTGEDSFKKALKNMLNID
jgi:tetraacyldisaccharide 4'-kinase